MAHQKCEKLPLCPDCLYGMKMLEIFFRKFPSYSFEVINFPQLGNYSLIIYLFVWWLRRRETSLAKRSPSRWQMPMWRNICSNCRRFWRSQMLRKKEEKLSISNWKECKLLLNVWNGNFVCKIEAFFNIFGFLFSHHAMV